MPAHRELSANPATQTETVIDPNAPAFILSGGPDALVVSGPTGPIARLATGEALFRSGTESTRLRAMAAAGGSGEVLSIVPGAGDPAVTFTPGPGARDVDLVREVLGTNEALRLRTEVSAFVVVISGAVDAGGTILATGSTIALSRDVTLFNRSPNTAVVAVASIGPLLSDSGDAPPVTQPAAPAPTPGTPSPQSPTPPADGPTTMAPSTTTATTTPAVPADTDSDKDGVTDARSSPLVPIPTIPTPTETP